MAEAHPVIFRLLNEQRKRNVKIIMVDPRKTLSAKIADRTLACPYDSRLDLSQF